MAPDQAEVVSIENSERATLVTLRPAPGVELPSAPPNLWVDKSLAIQLNEFLGEQDGLWVFGSQELPHFPIVGTTVELRPEWTLDEVEAYVLSPANRSGTDTVKVPYLAQASEDAISEAAGRFTAVAAEIARCGVWEEVVEWRISTDITRRIEVFTEDDKRWFKVTVSCEVDLVCRAPTLERAMEYLGVFSQMAMDLFWTLGWSS